MEKIRARHQGNKSIYVHNDLSNAAHHFKEQIESKLRIGDRKGITFDHMACLMTLAFTFEAKANFLGHKLVSRWKERQPFNDKLATILDHLNVEPDWSTRPYSSILRMKEFRDSIAHGKPVEIEFDEEVVFSEEEVDRKIDLDGEWVEFCSNENVFNTYDDIEEIWQDLIDRSSLQLFDTITHGSSGLTFIEKFVEKE